MLSTGLPFEENAKLFSKVVPFYCLTRSVYSYSTFSSTLGVVRMFLGHSSRSVVVSHCDFVFIFLKTSDIEHLFNCLLALPIFCEVSLQIFYTF